MTTCLVCRVPVLPSFSMCIDCEDRLRRHALELLEAAQAVVACAAPVRSGTAHLVPAASLQRLERAIRRCSTDG